MGSADAMSPSTEWEYFQLGPLKAPRLWNGLWQLSSTAWGSASASRIRQSMARHANQGYTAFDMVSSYRSTTFSYLVPRHTSCLILGSFQADHYGSAEILFGQFRESLPPTIKVIGGTKWCVFKDTEPTRAVVEAGVKERMTRMRTKVVDLLQLHWQNYSDNGYLPALRHLLDLQAEGVITNIGLCNFDAIRVDEICTQLGPGAIATNQVPFSLIDTRVLHGMADVCERHDVKLLTYGTLCGGFLSDTWFSKPEPDPYAGTLTPSQRKYLDIILKAWGSWELFQTLLNVLRRIGDRHGNASIANIATRWVLDHPCVGAVLIGSRLGVSEHPDDNKNVFRIRLSEEDRDDIEAVLDKSNGRKMITVIGDCGAEYR